MFYVPQQPCYKIYKESAHALRIVWFENESNMGHFKQKCVGDFLIQFLEMDLTEYETTVWQFGSGADFEPELLLKLGYSELKAQLLNSADLLSGNLHLHRFLIGVLTQFFEDEKLTDIEQMKSSYLELVYIIQMHRQFSIGMHFAWMIAYMRTFLCQGNSRGLYNRLNVFVTINSKQVTVWHQ